MGLPVSEVFQPYLEIAGIKTGTFRLQNRCSTMELRSFPCIRVAFVFCEDAKVGLMQDSLSRHSFPVAPASEQEFPKIPNSRTNPFSLLRKGNNLTAKDEVLFPVFQLPLYMPAQHTSPSGSRNDQPPCSKKPSGSSTIVFMILVQLRDCTPSVYLMSQELMWVEKEGRDECTESAERWAHIHLSK